MHESLAVKKQVSLRWSGARLDLDVAQDLFSSHQVDRGSKMLLSSLEPVDLPERGVAVDFGCGYGVLGIAWQAVHPGWSMRYVDRDALAVAFAQHNVGRAIPHLADRAIYHHDVTPPEPTDDGFDLVLWNVPGKAGAEVLASLTALVLDGLGNNGLLALVVVNPLAETIRETGANHPGVLVERDEVGRDHTVLHLRKITSDVSWRHAFDEGVFDRPDARFALGERSWVLTPVIGLPEYDSLSHSTTLAGDAMQQIGSDAGADTWLAHEPGVGHLAVFAGLLWPDAQGFVTSRDALALRSTQRALHQECPGTNVEFQPLGAPSGMMTEQVAVDLAMIAVPDQIQAEGLGEIIDAAACRVVPGGTVILHGGSTEIGRLERLASKGRQWRSGKRTKRSGMSAIPLLRRDLA